MIALPEVRLCRMCYIDDELAELVKYSTRHYAHPVCIADGWWIDRVRLLEDEALLRVRGSAHESGFDQLVSGIDAEIVQRRS